MTSRWMGGRNLSKTALDGQRNKQGFQQASGNRERNASIELEEDTDLWLPIYR